MNENTVQGSWLEIKGKIREKFGKLTDDEVEKFKGNLDQIVGKIQHVYGYAEEHAEREFKELSKTFHQMKDEMVSSTVKVKKEVKGEIKK